MKKRLSSSADVSVLEPDSSVGGGSVSRRGLPALAGEEDWEGEARATQCRAACAQVTRLVRTELGVNTHTLACLVEWLLVSRPPSVLGARLPAAVMQSHMGATVDRRVYHPQLRSALRSRHPLALLLPLAPADCRAPASALARAGEAVWASRCAARRRNDAQRPRGEREAGEESAPAGGHSLATAEAAAEGWAREEGSEGPVHVMLLVEETAACEKTALRGLFKCLAENKSDAIVFSVVLWASAETELDADLMDHLYWTSYPFLPAVTMLKNVMYAVLIEPNLPFLLPWETYSWIVRHFADESHSLAWLLHVLHSIIFSFYIHTPGSWALQPHLQHDAPPGLDAQLKRIFGFSSRTEWLAGLGEWKQFRKRRFEAFVELWELLRQWNPERTKSLFEEYAVFLRKGKSFSHYVESEMVRGVLLSGRAEIKRRYDATLAALVGNRTRLPRARNELENVDKSPEAESGGGVVVVDTGVVANTSTDSFLRKQLNPRDRLLSASTSNVAALKHGGVSSLRRSSSMVSTTTSGDDDKYVRAVLRCVRVILADLELPSESRLLEVSQFVAKQSMPAMLWGDTRAEVIDQLRHPSWSCACCSYAGSLSERKNERAKKKAKSDANDEEADSKKRERSSHEDICLAFSFDKAGRVDFAEWEAYFTARVDTEDAAEAKKRFHRAVRDLQCVGLASFSNSSAFLSKDDK